MFTTSNERSNICTPLKKRNRALQNSLLIYVPTGFKNFTHICAFSTITSVSKCSILLDVGVARNTGVI